MFAQERHRTIKKVIRENRRMSFADLEQVIGVSPATLRRDLSELEASGDIIRVHGGVLDPAYVRSETSFDERLLRNQAAKQAIAATAAALVPSGVSVFVDAGSTCLEAGKILCARTDVRIVTHSAALLAAALHGSADVVCLGGELRKVSGALTGGTALRALDLLWVDVALVAASGLSPTEGCSTTELSEAEMKQAILRRADRRILLADFTKWNRPSTVHFAPWTDFQDWVTDRRPLPAETKKLTVSIHAPVAKGKS